MQNVCVAIRFFVSHWFYFPLRYFEYEKDIYNVLNGYKFILVKCMDSFGIKLKRLRSEKELTQKELSSLLGLTRATISSYERCALYPSVEALISICQFFNVSADYMLGLTDTNTFDTSYLTDQQELIIRALLDEFREKNSKS